MPGRRTQQRAARRRAGAALAALAVPVMALGLFTAGVLVGRDRAPERVVTTAAPTVTATPAPTVTITEGTSDRVEVAQRTKPLRDLIAGDRVLYVSEPGGAGAVCEWNYWGGEIGVSNVTCGSETFDAPTGYLSPVESRP